MPCLVLGILRGVFFNEVNKCSLLSAFNNSLIFHPGKTCQRSAHIYTSTQECCLVVSTHDSKLCSIHFQEHYASYTIM